VFELIDWLKHKQIAGNQQHHCAQQRHNQHPNLQQVQSRRPPRHIRLDAAHHGINVCRKGDRIWGQAIQVVWLVLLPVDTKLAPVTLYIGKVLASNLIPQNVQRARSITIELP
jgi:hypothetical protein